MSEYTNNFNNNASVNLTGNDELDLELLQIEISATYIDIFSSILGLIAAEKAKELIIQNAASNAKKNQSQQNQNKNPNSANGKTKKKNNNNTQNSNNSKQKQDSQQQQVQHPTPSEIATIASCLGVYTILIYTRVSIIRFYELYSQIQDGTSNFSLTPNINITLGFLYSVIGSILRTVGAIQRVDEEAQITIF